MNVYRVQYSYLIDHSIRFYQLFHSLVHRRPKSSSSPDSPIPSAHEQNKRILVISKKLQSTNPMQLLVSQFAHRQERIERTQKEAQKHNLLDL